MWADQQLSAAICHEVEAIHDFFEHWMKGRLSEDVFDSTFLPRMSSNFTMIPPSGSTSPLSKVITRLRDTRGAAPGLEIAIQNVVVRHAFPGHALATFEEWQRDTNSPNTKPTARASSALFATEEQLVWLHLHETWMKPEYPPPRFAQS